MVFIAITEGLVYLFVSLHLGMSLVVLKYGPLKTKLLYIITGFLLYGYIIKDYNMYLGVLFILIGVILSAPYVAKAFRDIIPNL